MQQISIIRWFDFSPAPRQPRPLAKRLTKRPTRNGPPDDVEWSNRNRPPDGPPKLGPPNGPQGMAHQMTLNGPAGTDHQMDHHVSSSGPTRMDHQMARHWMMLHWDSQWELLKYTAAIMDHKMDRRLRNSYSPGLELWNSGGCSFTV